MENGPLSMESSTSISQHVNMLSQCVNQLAAALNLSREQVAAYGRKVMSSFASGKTDFLLVDRVLVLMKQIQYHAQAIIRQLRDTHIVIDRAHVRAMLLKIRQTLYSALASSAFFRGTFGGMADDLLQTINSAV